VATVYVESSIISYLREQPNRDIVIAARQVLTHRWWNRERAKYELVTSQYVIDEVSAADSDLAAERLRALDGIPLLPNAREIATMLCISRRRPTIAYNTC